MVDQTNPPRTQDAQIQDVFSPFAEERDERELSLKEFRAELIEAEARGRAEAFAELRAKDKARIAELEAKLREARRAIKDAAQFIDNGIEFGFIRMPDPDTPDAAHNTREHLRAALAAAPEKRG